MAAVSEPDIDPTGRSHLQEPEQHAKAADEVAVGVVSKKSEYVKES